MIRYLNNTDINKEKWNACIQSSLQPSIFVYSWYLDTVCVCWGGLVLNDYEAVFPLAFNKKFGIRYIYQPFFTRYFGIYSDKAYTIDLVNVFLDAIPPSFKYIILCLNVYETNPFKRYLKKTRHFQILDLDQPYEQLQQNFSSNTKRNIKKAQKAGLRIGSEISPQQIVDLFRCTKGEELKTFKEKDYQRLVDVMECCLKRNCGESIAVYENEEVCAAAFFTYSDNTFMFLKSGVTDKGRENGAMHLLMSNFIRTYSNRKSILDFGGSSVESVARFYKSFGARDCLYLQLEKDNLLRRIKWMKSFKF